MNAALLLPLHSRARRERVQAAPNSPLPWGLHPTPTLPCCTQGREHFDARSQGHA
jgi:hypothetical protein